MEEKNIKQDQPNNPLHGVKLVDILNYLVEMYGWESLGSRIEIRCFKHDPSVKSSLAFLRKTPWAREKVEQLYLDSLSKKKIQKKWIEFILNLFFLNQSFPCLYKTANKI